MPIHKTISTHSPRPASAREARREEHETVMVILDYNTGGKQQATASTTSIRQIAQQNSDVVAYGNRVVRARADELRAALEAGDTREQPDRTKMRVVAKALTEVDR